jgi:NitT/TauT family transport system substrate-binding protein
MKKAATATLIVAVLFPSLFVYITNCSKTQQQFEKIVIGVEAVPHTSPVWIAEHNDYFRKEGLNVEVKEFESGRTALRMMLHSEGIDIVTAAQTPVVSNSFSRNDYAIIGNMVYSDNDVKLLVKLDKGLKTPSDLKGKVIGITVDSSGHFFLGLFLAHHRLLMSDVRIADREATRLAQSLIDGQVDAIATWEPHIYNAKKVLGDKALVMPSEGMYREDFYFIARKDFIRSHHETLKRFLRAIQKGEDFIQNNRKEALDIVGQRLKIDKKILMETWGDFHFMLSLDQSILIALEDEARWAIKNGLTETTKVPNYLDYIYTDALMAVNPDAVTMAGK